MTVMTHPLKGRKQSPEHIAKRSAAMKGKKRGPLSPEHRAVLSALKKGKMPANMALLHSPEVRAIAGPAISAAKFKGENIGYGHAHGRVRQVRGQATTHKCEHCRRVATNWALKHDAPKEHVKESRKPYMMAMLYSTYPEDYMPLCASCHAKYDQGARINGH